jgi:CBS domain-containing protein
LGWFGKIKGEKAGEHSGQLEIKKAGIFAITDGIKALAIEGRFLDGSTSQRLEAARAAGTLREAEATDLEESYEFLVQMRLRCQVEAIREGRAPDNYIALDQLNIMEQGRLKIALTGVEKFQAFIKHHFGLHLARN